MNMLCFEVKKFRRFQHLYWLNLSKGQSSGAVSVLALWSTGCWSMLRRETTEHGRPGPKVTLSTARPGEEGEEKPNLPLLLAQGLQGILSTTSPGAMDCCFIHRPKPKPKTLRQYQLPRSNWNNTTGISKSAKSCLSLCISSIGGTA